jgi:hypothetical protein
MAHRMTKFSMTKDTYMAKGSIVILDEL